MSQWTEVDLTDYAVMTPNSLLTAENSITINDKHGITEHDCLDQHFHVLCSGD